MISNTSTRWMLTIASGLALALAFPKFDFDLLAWVAFVPLLYAIVDLPFAQVLIRRRSHRAPGSARRCHHRQPKIPPVPRRSCPARSTTTPALRSACSVATCHPSDTPGNPESPSP